MPDSQDRLVRKEVALGAVRELPVNPALVGASFAPWQAVESDDVVFDYVSPSMGGLAPARAEDAESELARKDDVQGTGRASIIDWAIKTHYSASDVSRYRELLGNSGSRFITNMTEGFAARIARDTADRKNRLDNRHEMMVMDALSDGVIAYDDGKIKFSVDFGRPAAQQAQAPASSVLWDAGATHDPIGDLNAVKAFMRDTYGLNISRAITSQKVLDTMVSSEKFYGRTGLAATGPSDDIKYLDPNWSASVANGIVSAATGITFQTYDAGYRVRDAAAPKGWKFERFTPDNRIILLPSEADLAQVTDSFIGFGKTLTSPHPEGNWGTGFYEWERSTVDPWGQDIGTGVKMFPVFPHMDLTFTLDVLA